jgi:SAM-dependent methyltransferase
MSDERSTSKLNNPAYLKAEQYRDAGNLNARIALHARFSTNKQGWFSWVFDHLLATAQLATTEQAQVVELGCGPAGLWSANRARIPAGWKLLLTDFSPGMAAQAQAAVAGDARFAVAVADATAIPVAGRAAGVVLANHMLYHVPDLRRALSEMRRVLKPGGRLHAATVGMDHMRELTEMVVRFDPELARASMNMTGHYESFSLENGAAQLGRVFDHVALLRYEDALVVNEAEPLVAYILSIAGAHDEETRARLLAFVEGEQAARGSIYITKSTGMFVCR